ncbi:MAG: hypothetical protein H6736_00775 [Alphaproteobacteria bacterium]|nr:hypothetical protein [Alphaproteobacteria bacterium]MCB9690324.1 hypothetical protein [Alphaproteobacteria bacterium]
MTHPLLFALVGCTPGVSPDGTPVEGWVDVVARPCALHSSGEVQCWHDGGSEALSEPEQVPGLTSLHLSGDDVLRGIDATGYAHTLAVSPLGALWDVREEAYRQLGHEGGIGWAGNARYAQFACELQGDWVLAGQGSTVFLDASDAVWIGRMSPFWCDEPIPIQVEPEGEPVTVVGGRRDWTVDLGDGMIACVLDDLGTISCAASGSYVTPVFDAPPYRRLVGAGDAICAQQWDHRVVCADGRQLDWGPLRALSMGSIAYPGPNGMMFPGAPGFSYGLCAITADDRIRCDGAAYSGEVLDALEDL